jgi:bifunctional non-homologous end joining protein LigD
VIPEDEYSGGTVLLAARRLRELLDELGLVPLVKTTGSEGLHVVTPLPRERDFDEVRDFCRRVADLLVARYSERLTTAQRKDRRNERLYLDVQRNAYGQHEVVPYAVRALPGAPVATPLDWSELDRSGVGPKNFTVANLFRRLGQRDDPWRGAWRKARSLDRPLDRLAALEERGG